jgi:hypothetical protein
MTLIRSWNLGNSLVVEVKDESVTYYGDYHNIKLIIRCRIGVEHTHLDPFRDNPRFEKATRILGPIAEYRREIVKAGVPGKDLVKTKGYLLERFEDNALAYFEREDFAMKFVRKRLTDIIEDLEKQERHGEGDGA